MADVDEELEELARPVVRDDHDDPFRLSGAVIPAAGVRRQVRGHIEAIERCYQPVVRRDRELRGRIVLELRIEPSGAVEARIVEDEIGDQALARCLRRVFDELRVAADHGPGVRVVRYPFVFAPAPTSPEARQ